MTYIELIKNILNKYIEYEMESNLDYKYYCHREIDSNVTNFEGLSNCNKIVIKSKLNHKQMSTIMILFQCIYDSNYYIFENTDNNYLIDYDSVDDNILVKLSKYDLEEWLKLFEKDENYDENNDENNDEKSDKHNDIENNTIINNVQIFDDVPYYEKKYIKQKIYSLNDIIDLIT